MEGKLSSGHGRAILQVPEDAQEAFAATIIANGYTVRITELEARNYTADKKKPSKKKIIEKSPAISEYEKELQSKFAVKVNIVDDNKKGRISFFYKNHKELDKILAALRNSNE